MVLEVLTFGLPDLANENMGHCWRRLLRGHDCCLTCGHRRLLTPSPALEHTVLPMVPTVGAVFKDAALRKQCVFETIWMVHGLKPVKDYI